MSGATRTIQQPAATGSLAAAVAMTALIVSAAFAVGIGFTNRTASPVAAPASIDSPLGRLNAGDLTPAAAPRQGDDTTLVVGPQGPIGYHASDALAQSSGLGYHGFGGPAALGATSGNGVGDQALGYHGFGGPAPATTSNGSNQAAPAVHRPGLRPS